MPARSPKMPKMMKNQGANSIMVLVVEFQLQKLELDSSVTNPIIVKIKPDANEIVPKLFNFTISPYLFILRIVYEHSHCEMLCTLYSSPQNKKSAPTEVNAPKTQTPIVAKQIKIELEHLCHAILWSLQFYHIYKRDRKRV